MKSKIVRRPDRAEGGITEEEKERMAAHSALWIQRALRTEPASPAIIEEAIKGIYRAANFWANSGPESATFHQTAAKVAAHLARQIRARSESP